MAIGQGCNPLLVEKSGLEKGKKGNIAVNEDMMASNEKVFAAGDIISGASTVIKAIGDAKIAASAIDKYLNKV